MYEMESNANEINSDKPWLSSEPYELIKGLPDYGFRVKFDHNYPRKCKPFRNPRLHQIRGFVGFSFRYVQKWFQQRKRGSRLFIDNFNMVPWQPIYGAPIGGVGSGTIGRGFRGEFCRFQLIPGIYHHEVVDANQFILTLRHNYATVYQNVLNPKKKTNHGVLSTWKWGFPSSNGIYHALYPMSWTVYEIPEHNVRLICKQVSPFIPGDYKDSTLPCAIFEWTIENSGYVEIEASLTFTFKNGQGTSEDKEGGAWSEGFEGNGSSMEGDVGLADHRGVFIHQKIKYMDCTYAISAQESDGCQVSRMLKFDPNGNGSELWTKLAEDGRLCTEPSIGSSHVTNNGEELGVAVCSSTSIGPGRSGKARFCLAWYMPLIKFGGLENVHRRRFSRYFDSALSIVNHSFSNYPHWVNKIGDWQNPILNCCKLPSWYKSALFNELYFISDGGTVWIEASPVGDFTEVPGVVQEYGRFAYLEGHEYRMYNTYDVHHYASFALLMLWPKLQLSLQYDVASFVRHEQSKLVKFCMDGSWGCTKTADCVPHDIGDPSDEPWSRLNAYSIHPTVEWKDLNVKFVLQVYRDYVYTKDVRYLKDMYPLVKVVMEKCLRWDVDDDGVIDNAGFADQTFDAWSMKGASAYCGGMWLAAVKMFIVMAEFLDRSEDASKFTDILKKGIQSYESKLWNGKYYNFDSSSSSHHDSCMADQLVGHWFLKASKIGDYEVVSKDHVMSTLKSILELNVLPYHEGKMGAINGARPDGSPDITSMQSEEFWTGVTYSIGAIMIQEGMVEDGWRTAYGAYHTCYDRFGLAFQTPEAYFIDGKFRSLGYMRPLAIWAVQLALQTYHPDLLS